MSLKGKSLIEAIDLLKNAGDMVTLKISRKLDLNTHNSSTCTQSNLSHCKDSKNLENNKHVEANINGASQKYLQGQLLSDKDPLLIRNTENFNHKRLPQHNPQQHNYCYGNSANEKSNENSDFINNNEYQKSLQYRK